MTTKCSIVKQIDGGGLYGYLKKLYFQIAKINKIIFQLKKLIKDPSFRENEHRSAIKKIEPELNSINGL